MAKSVQLNGWARLVIYVVVIAAAACVAWGAVRYNVIDNTKDITEIKNRKLDKEVFQMYIEQEEKAETKRDKFLEKMDEKLDKVLKK